MGPTPHGVGGLKLFNTDMVRALLEVPPRTGWVD